jgi:transcriptional regulator with XRE-family HTH domain
MNVELSLACGCLLACLAHADAPGLTAQQLAQKLGVTEGALSYCNSIDPASAKKLRAKVADLEKEASAEYLAQARNSDEYREAFAQIESFAARVDQHNAKTMCTNTASDSKQGR